MLIRQISLLSFSFVCLAFRGEWGDGWILNWLKLHQIASSCIFLSEWVVWWPALVCGIEGTEVRKFSVSRVIVISLVAHDCIVLIECPSLIMLTKPKNWTFSWKGTFILASWLLLLFYLSFLTLLWCVIKNHDHKQAIICLAKLSKWFIF